MLRKIIIFGNSGSGKSTLAREIVEQEALAHLDLDTLAWLPVTPPRRAPLSESKREIDQFIKANKAWVIEGCYADLIELAGSEANEVIFMNLEIDTCIENAKNRPWEPHKYESRAAQDKNLPMLIDWIRNYRDRDDEFSYRSHKKFYENFKGKKTMYTGNDRNA